MNHTTPMRPATDPDGPRWPMPHPAAELFPMMTAEELEALAKDIKIRGLLEPIVLDRDTTADDSKKEPALVLDGRNRMEACKRADVAPRFVIWDGRGGTPTGYVLAINLTRRHLTPSQRAAVATDAMPLLKIEMEAGKKVKCAEAGKKGGRGNKAEEPDAPSQKGPGNLAMTLSPGEIAAKAVTPKAEPKLARDEAAKVAGVSPRYVQEAESIKDRAPDLMQEIRDGKKTIPQAKRALAKRDDDERRANAPREMCSVKDLAALAREVQSGKRKPFGCVYLDPPWQYDNQGSRGATDNEYPTMSFEDIKALPIADLAGDQCHLHMWVTVPFHRKAYELLDAWGFAERGYFVWIKSGMGLGNYWRISHESMLLGTRGGLVFSDHGLQSYGEFAKGKHSVKPDEVRGLVERASPGPYLELFGRRLAPGWVVWGNDVERSAFEEAKR